MEPVRRIIQPRTIGLVDLQLVLNSTVNIKVKLQLIQKISDTLEECCRTQNYFDNMIFVFLKLLTITEPVFSPDNDVFKMRKLILQIIHKICSSNDKIKQHIQNIMGVCLKIIETDNEQCVIYCILIFKELLTAFKPKFDGCFKLEIFKFLKLIMDMYNNSSTQEKIFNFQKTSDLKVLISTIRLTTTITKNSVNYIFVPMGKVSFKVLKELAHILKLYYVLYYGIQSFKKEIIEFFPILMNFFNLDIPYKPDYRDLVLDLKHAQVRLLFFFAIFLKDNKDAIRIHCSTLPGRIISFLNCNMSSDVSNLRTELLSGFESVILIDYKCEFLPFMDKFLDETLITGRSWSLKNVLRPKAYIYIDHLTTHLHNQLSLNFLVRVIHSHFSNILDTTLQPEVQINLCNMVMNVLSYIVQRQNQIITNINTIEKNKNPIIDLFYRVFQIFVIKLKQFQKFYLPQLDESSISQENVKESISSILAENQFKKDKKQFMYGYHSSQITPYTLADSKRFIKIIIPAIRTLFQFIVKIEGGKFPIEYHYKKSFKNFINHSIQSLKICNCSIQKKDIAKEILSALSCINPIHLKILIIEENIVKQIYTNNLESIVFDITLNDEVLVPTFSCVMFECIKKNLVYENERECVFDLINRLRLNFKLNNNDETINECIYKIIQKSMSNLKNTKQIMFYMEILKIMLFIMETATYEFGKNINSLLKILFCDLYSYYQNLSCDIYAIKNTLVELCLAECVIKVVLNNKIMELLSVISYSLKIPELTPRGLTVLEKCLNCMPNNFFEDPNLQIRNDIMKELCHCIDSPLQSTSQSAVMLLGKFGGFNRSSIIKPYNLNAQKIFCNDSKKPKIYLSFEKYNHKLLELDIELGINTAVETLISSNDNYNRVHSWNVIRGFLIVSMECDKDEVLQLLSYKNWRTFVDLFVCNKLQYLKTSIDETYIKALTGLMICCGDKYLKEDAINYLNKFTKLIVYIAIFHFSGIPSKNSLKVNPFVLIDAITILISKEKEILFNIGLLAIDMIIKELRYILKDIVIYFPFITYMLKQFCELCYDASWIRKRGGCFGLQILFLNLLSNNMTKELSDWFSQSFFTVFRATLFIFSDFNENLTFGTLEIARKNLKDLIKWFYFTKSTNSSFNLIQEAILKEIIYYIFGPNDVLRDESIKIINLLAEKQQKSVNDILKPYNKYFNRGIPGNRLFNKYTYKSQIGIMKGHIYCALHSLPPIKLNFSKHEHKYYFKILCIACNNKNDTIKKIKIFKYLTSNQLLEFRLTAMQVLANCIKSLIKKKQKKVFKIFINILKNDDCKLQETAYQCLNSYNPNLLMQKPLVNKIFLFYADLFKDHTKVTLNNIRYIMYLSKLFPSQPNTIMCTILLNAFKCVWNDLHHCNNKFSKNKLELVIENILETVYLVKEAQFLHVQELCEIILNENILNIELCNKLYPLLAKCLLKFPENCLELFFQEKNIKNLVWSSYFNSLIRNVESKSLRNILTLENSHLENLLSSARIDPSRTIQYESVRIIYNLVQMDKKWNINKKLISTLLNIWSNPQYKERYKNLAAIKSIEWDEPKMLLKIVLAYYKNNIDNIFILFQILPVFSYRFPVNINFFRKYLENEVINSYSIKWKRMVFFKFIDLYQKKGVNGDIIGKILQYLILPCFSMCYKNGEKEQLLCTFSKSDENIIGVVLNKIFNNIRTSLTGCDFDGIKVFICQLVCLLIDELLNFNENICDLIYNAVISCTWIRCTMDINVKFHCYLILTFIMLSNNASKREKLNQGIYYELLKASFAEAQTVINYSLNLIVSAVCEKNKEVNTLVVCVKKIMMTESQNVPTLHHICSFLIKYNTLFYPYKQFLIRNILGSLFPIAKNNNVPEFKKTSIELACMIIKWELSDDNMKLEFPIKRKLEDITSSIGNNSPLQKRKSSETIDNCLNFLAMVGCQTHDDKQESRISKLAMRSATLFKNILSTEPIDTKEVKLKFGWIEKLLDTFLKKENLVKQNPNAHGNTNASVMNLLTTFDIISFMLNFLSQKLMLEAIKPLQDHLITFLQLAFNEPLAFNSSHSNQRDMLSNNRLTVSQIKQYNEGTLKVILEILKTFPSSEGLEKLHTYIQMIISEGLNSNCSHKLEISLIILKDSLVNFPNYMDNEVLNTIGDVMFKFDKNNENPSIKIKCLEILKSHVDTLSRVGKQVFIEKVVIENLDKARHIENSIPLEVQLKCFELIITYIQDISEATEGILLNSTILEFIKTTTDERIMTIILNAITKWIEICRDESVLFNSQVIKILKCVTTINRFPKLFEYCYKLNLEVFKNWYFNECIEYGLDCKSPAIRNEFFNFYNTLCHNDGLCSKLYTIMSNEQSYDLEFSVAFYVEVLLDKVSKNIKLQGNFPMLSKNKPFNINKTPNFSENINSVELNPVLNIFTFDMCKSLAQLCFLDVDLAKHIWITILPGVWSLFDDDQKDLLSSKAKTFLAKSKLKNNFMTAFYEAIILCEPKIYFEPYQMVHIGKTYNLWYKVIEQMENMCNYYENSKKDEAIEGIIQMYSLLREEDVLECLLQNTIQCKETIQALTLEQQGNFRNASQMYIKLLNRENNHIKVNQTDWYNKDSQFRKIRLTKCLRELNEWEFLSEHLIGENNFLLNIENIWRKSIDNHNFDDFKWSLQYQQKIWPSTLNWKYHFYLGMLGLNELDEQVMSTVQEHIELAVNEIIEKWKVLPKYLCNAHIPLLQSTQLITEIQEAHDIQKNWLETSNNITVLIDIWKNRKPWIGDNLFVWNDLISWRQTYFTFLILRDIEYSQKHYINCSKDELKLLFGEIALKQNMVDVCLKSLNTLNSNLLNASNWFNKIYLKAKCVQKDKKYDEKFESLMNSNLNNAITEDMKPLLLTIKGILQDYRGNTDVAFKYFTMAFYNQLSTMSSSSEWQCVVHDNLKNMLPYNFLDGNRKRQFISFVSISNSNKILENAWIQWAALIEKKFVHKDTKNSLVALQCYIMASKLTNNIKCNNIIIAKILWLLTYDDDKYTLLRTLEKCNIVFSDLWVPQILKMSVDKNNTAIKGIILKIGKLYPQKIYLTLNRMYLTEKIRIKSVNRSTIIKKKEDYLNVFIRIKKIKKMMEIMKQKYSLETIQLDYFLNQITALGESWDEELRRKLYECLYLCYDYAFESKNLDVWISNEIWNFIETISIINQDINSDKFKMKKTFLIPDYLSECYLFFKQKFSIDFNLNSVSTVKMMINQLKKWIRYLEHKSNYPTKIVLKLRCSGIHNTDWSTIRLPCDHHVNDLFETVRIHNFNSYIHLNDKHGTVIKQLSIRGTDGLLYRYNVSKGQQIESKERIRQLFHVANNYLLDFKETAKRFLKFSIPRTFTISPDICMVETNRSIYSLFDIYNEMSKVEWIHEDIEFWFSVLNTCVITDRTDPLTESLVITGKKFNSEEVLKNWVSLRYPLQSDYWTFRKTFIEHYSLLCFFEYSFNLTKLKPEMLNLDENNGAAIVLQYTFFLNKIDGNLIQTNTIPFRMTPNLTTFITPYRKCQMINCLTATSQCINNSINEISVVVKLLLKDEFRSNNYKKNNKDILDGDQQIIEKVENNFNFLINKIDNLQTCSSCLIPNLLNQSSYRNYLCYENPTYRPWL